MDTVFWFILFCFFILTSGVGLVIIVICSYRNIKKYVFYRKKIKSIKKENSTNNND